MIILDKLEGRKLAVGLTHKEFRCKCEHESCRSTLVSKDFLQVWKVFRTQIGIECHINSGYRCQRHNLDIGGVRTSWHCAGFAIDVDAKNLLSRYTIDEVINIAMASGFKFVKYYEDLGFFHFDVGRR